MPKTYIVSYAQNATPIEPLFWASLHTFCGNRGAELLVVPGRYKNPTSVFLPEDRDHEWWAPETVPFLHPARADLANSLRLFGDVKIQPTRKRPLGGKNVFVGKHSAIFGHPRRQLTTAPNGRRTPRLLVTTGACTVPNYTDSNAGKEAQEHHVLGALIVEVQDDGIFYIRHVTRSEDGSFQDLDNRYHPDGRVEAAEIATLTPGDIHARTENPAVMAALQDVVETCRPTHIFLHDTLDFRTRNHHGRTLLARYETHKHKVEDEVRAAAAVINRFLGMGDRKQQVVIVRSNHDQAFERWVNEADAKEDLLNAKYLYFCLLRCLTYYDKFGEYPNLFAMEARRLGVRSKRARFLGDKEDYVAYGIQHGFHGHQGLNGARGSLNGYAQFGAKCTIGHGHGAAILDGVWRAGLTGNLDQGYNNPRLSGWTYAAVVGHHDGKRQMLIFVDGKYRL